MSKVAALVRREFSAYFVSAIAYVVLTVFLAIAGLAFGTMYMSAEVGEFSYGAVVSLMKTMAMMLLFLVPLLTMRLLSEEINSGTFETLMTAPVSNSAVVVSKFLGAVGVLCVMLIPTVAFPVMLYSVAGAAGDVRPDPGPIVSGYFGLALLGMTTVAAGVCVSACVRNQVSAAVAAALLLALLWWAGKSPEPAVRYLGILHHYESFAKGVIDTRDVVYYLTATGLFLFGAVGVLAVRRWR